MVAAALLLALGAVNAWAADAAGGWRPTYDLIMRWVNFLILVFILVKYGRAPIKSFLAGQKDEITREISLLEEAKEAVMAKNREHAEAFKAAMERLEDLKVRVVQQGERYRTEMITDAQNESRLLIESARQKIDYKIYRARKRLRAELIDAAFDQATAQLPQEITSADNDNFLDQYFSHIATG